MSSIILAISGGIDSSVLLHVVTRGRLSELPGGRGDLLPMEATYVVAHFNHHIHEEADTHAEFVRGLAAGYGLEYVLGEARTSLRSEAEAREARYGFLRGLAEEREASMIMTAHHADDQAETVLLNLLRGSGVAGIAGMRERDGLLTRPLLGVSKSAIREYAARHGLTNVEDPTNSQERYARNLLRQRVMPELARLNTGAVMNMTTSALLMREANEALEAFAEAFIKEHAIEGVCAVPMKSISMLPDSALRYVLRAIVKRAQGDLMGIEKAHIDEVVRICRAEHGNKQKECGKVLFTTTRQEGIRVLVWNMTKNDVSD